MFTRWRFKSAVRRALKEKRATGEITRKLEGYAERDTTLNRAYDELDIPWWRSLFSWVSQNWPTILSVLILFLEESDE